MIDILELINEPAAYFPAVGNNLASFYQQGYQVVRNTAGIGLQVMISDGFMGVQVSQLHQSSLQP